MISVIFCFVNFIFGMQDDDVTIETMLAHFRLTPGAHAEGCLGVSAETVRQRSRAEQRSAGIVLHAQQSPPPRPSNCISNNLDLQLHGVRCGRGGLQPMPLCGGEEAAFLSTPQLQLGISASSSSAGPAPVTTGCRSAGTVFEGPSRTLTGPWVGSLTVSPGLCACVSTLTMFLDLFRPFS